MTLHLSTPDMARVIDAVYSKQPLIEKALKHSGGGWTFDDVVEAISILRYIFWVNQTSFAITETIDYPQYRILHVFLSGGVLEDIFDLEEQVAVYGRAIGCKKMTILGREGFTRLLPPRWKQTHVFMSRDIGD